VYLCVEATVVVVTTLYKLNVIATATIRLGISLNITAV
jgi:hypothetical protein